MPFIRRQDIDPKLRAKHDARYKSQLRQALLSPGLSAEQRAGIQSQLANVGVARIYNATSAPKPGALSFETPPSSETSSETSSDSSE